MQGEKICAKYCVCDELTQVVLGLIALYVKIWTNKKKILSV